MAVIEDKKFYNNWKNTHLWLKRHFGKARKCENLRCETPDRFRYHYALLRNKIYEKKRENFIQLCPQCHAKYDRCKNYNIIIRI